LVISCFIQLYSVQSIAREVVSNFIPAFVVGILLVVTPGAIVVFCRKNKTTIKESQQESEESEEPQESETYKRYKSLLGEFDCTERFEASYTYALFTLVRLLLGVSLILLTDFPYTQATINTVLMVVFAVFLLVVRPYKDKLQQLVSVIVETGVFVVYLVAMYFLSDWGGKYKAEEAVIYLTYGLIGLRTLFVAAGALQAIARFIKRKCQRTRVVSEVVETRFHSTYESQADPNLQDNSLFVKTHQVQSPN